MNTTNCCYECVLCFIRKHLPNGMRPIVRGLGVGRCDKSGYSFGKSEVVNSHKSYS